MGRVRALLVLTCLVVPALVLSLTDLLVEEAGTSMGSELVALGLTGLLVSGFFLALREGDLVVVLVVGVFVISVMLVASRNSTTSVWGSVATDSGTGTGDLVLALRVRDLDLEMAGVLIVGKTGTGDCEPSLL